MRGTEELPVDRRTPATATPPLPDEGWVSTGPPELSVVVPTYNEADNIATTIERIVDALGQTSFEIIVVDDDSPDRTWQLASTISSSDARVKVLRRMGCRGLSSAVLAGMDAARGEVLAVIDADLQHDERILPDLARSVAEGRSDVCLGSRKAQGGSYGEFGPLRRLMSFAGAQLACQLLGISVSDPMSGFFAVSRQRYEAIRPAINPRGFKILLDILATGDRPRIDEIGYRFRARRRGETKLSGLVVGAYLVGVVELALRRQRASALTAFVAVSVVALSVRLSVGSVLSGLGVGWAAGALAIEAGLLIEFAGHHHYTFATRRAFGPGGPSLATRLYRFHAIAIHTLLAQTGLAATVTAILGAPADSRRLALVFAVATGGIMATLAAAYHLNRLLTWPGAPRPPLEAARPAQTSRPMTTSTRASISSTARR